MSDGIQVLRIAEAAELVGVEANAIKRWINDRGCPCVTRKPYAVEMGALRAWMAKHMDETGSFAGGGGRGGNHAKKAAALESVRIGPDRATEPNADEADDGGEPEFKVPTTGDELMALVRTNGVTAAEIKLWDAACELADKLDDAKVKRGRLIDADEVKQAMRQWCIDIRERVLQAPARIAAKGGELGLNQADQVRLKELAERVIADVLVSLRTEAKERV